MSSLDPTWMTWLRQEAAAAMAREDRRRQQADAACALASAYLVRALSRDTATDTAAINHDAATLGDALAPDLPYPTDEPHPDLSHLWDTSRATWPTSRVRHEGSRRFGQPARYRAWMEG